MFPNFDGLRDNEEIKGAFDDEIAFKDEWEHEKLKVLVAKFNNKIASLWNDEKSARNARKSVWCFDNTNWSPRSSNTSSPKLNECFKNKWFSIAPFENSSALWEPLQKHAVNYSIASANECDVDDLFAFETEKASPKLMHENKTSLSNHGDDSLFVEVPSRRNGSFSDHCASELLCFWNEEKSARNARKSIWCFDNTNWSPQSSNTPSPKLNECFKNKWFSIAPFEDSSAPWEPLQKHAVNYSIASANECDVDDLFAFETEKASPKLIHENKTSLSNHGDDSLFVEVPSRRNGSLSDHCASDTQHATSDCYLAIEEPKSKDDDSSECLLTSPKTHFQPIKQDSFDEEDEDATTIEADAEVSRLVPCSSICPNNDVKCDSKSQSSQESKNRSLSTSLPELTLFMGPFTDNELEEEKLSIEKERHSSKACVDCENEKKKVTSLSSNEENEFEELCTMLNEVLRDDTSTKPFVDSDVGWFDRKEKVAINAEQRCSWSGFWGSYKPESDHDSSHREFFAADDVQQENDFRADTGATSNDVESIAAFPIADCEYEECEKLVSDKSLEWFNENTTEYLPLRNDAYNASVEWSAGGEYEYTNTMTDECADPAPVFCCWNLEKEWQKEEGEDCAPPQQQRAVEEWSGKRPCTFFMEGNCRRSDCKFSHDLRSITCKFWEEGCCFKGFLCPFLHGYPSESKNRKVSASNPKFLIESEADFPSLSTGNCNSEAYLSESSESNVSPAKSKGKRFKQESNVLYRMVKKKRKKAGNQCYNEKEV